MSGLSNQNSPVEPKEVQNLSLEQLPPDGESAPPRFLGWILFVLLLGVLGVLMTMRSAQPPKPVNAKSKTKKSNSAAPADIIMNPRPAMGPRDQTYRVKKVPSAPHDADKAIESDRWFPWTPSGVEDFDYLETRAVPLVQLVLDDEQQKILAETLKVVTAQGLLLSKDHTWMPAKLIEGDRTYEVKARLRGDSPVHWSGPLKSWRVRFMGDALFHGMREVNFIVPGDRYILMEALAVHCGRALGLLTLRDGFGLLSFNGQPPGMYYISEEENAQFLQVSKRDETAIYDRRDVGFEAFAAGLPANMSGDVNSSTAIKNALKPTSREPIYRAALERYLNAKTDEEFAAVADIEKDFKYQAVSMIFGLNHGRAMHNVKLYYNLHTGLFEPIVWDVSMAPRDPAKTAQAVDTGFEDQILPHDDMLFRKPEIQYQRNKWLWSLIKPGDRDIYAAYEALRRNALPALRGASQEHMPYNYEVGQINFFKGHLVNNVTALRKALQYSRVSAHATFQNATVPTSVHKIKMVNMASSPVNVEMIQIDGAYAAGSEPIKVYSDVNMNGMVDDKDVLLGQFQAQSDMERLVFRPTKELLLYSNRNEKGGVEEGTHQLLLTGGTMTAGPQRVHYALTNAVTGEPISQDNVLTAVVDAKYDHDYAERMMGVKEFLATHPQFHPDPQNPSGVLLPAGDYAINDDIIVPQGCGLRIEAGAHLNFALARSLYCYGDLQVQGRPDDQVTFKPQEGVDHRGIVAVIGPQKKESKIESAWFYRGRDGTACNTFFTGSLSVNACPVRLLNSRIEGAQDDDGVHMVDCTGEINDCLFKDNFSDAIDLDWGSVNIRRCVFVNNGTHYWDGDSLDLSGVRIVIEHNVISGSMDKGISIGENSEVTVFDNYIEKCGIGIAAKDHSSARVISNTILDCEVGMAAYQKKSIFGGGHAEVQRSIVWGCPKPVEFDNVSVLKFDRCDIEGHLTKEGRDLGIEPGRQGTNLAVKPTFNLVSLEGERGGWKRIDASQSPQLLLTAEDRAAINEWLLSPMPEAGESVIGYLNRPDLTAKLPSPKPTAEIAAAKP